MNHTTNGLQQTIQHFWAIQTTTGYNDKINKDDILNSENNEDKEILQSIAYAEKQMG